MDTWSSLLPLVGTESTLAGCAQHLHLRKKVGRGKLGDHETGLNSGIPREKRQELGQIGVEQSLDSPFADAGDVRERDREEVRRLSHDLRVKIPGAHDQILLREDQADCRWHY